MILTSWSFGYTFVSSYMTLEQELTLIISSRDHLSQATSWKQVEAPTTASDPTGPPCTSPERWLWFRRHWSHLWGSSDRGSLWRRLEECINHIVIAFQNTKDRTRSATALRCLLSQNRSETTCHRGGSKRASASLLPQHLLPNLRCVETH